MTVTMGKSMSGRSSDFRLHNERMPATNAAAARRKVTEARRTASSVSRYTGTPRRLVDGRSPGCARRGGGLPGGGQAPGGPAGGGGGGGGGGGAGGGGGGAGGGGGRPGGAAGRDPAHGRGARPARPRGGERRPLPARGGRRGRHPHSRGRGRRRRPALGGGGGGRRAHREWRPGGPARRRSGPDLGHPARYARLAGDPRGAGAGRRRMGRGRRCHGARGLVPDAGWRRARPGARAGGGRRAPLPSGDLPRPPPPP